MIKLNSICRKLEEIKTKLEEKIEAIEDKAADKDRDLTEKEEERIADMQAEADDIDNALLYLTEYCDDDYMDFDEED